MDLNFLIAKCSVRKLSAMLISNSSWITAASAFIFPGKSLQGILMTSRESLSSGNTVITHCQGGWKRTNRKFPCGKMCFISSPFSCQSSGGRYNWNKWWEETKAVTLSIPCPYAFAKFWPCNWDAFPGCGPRARAEWGTQHRNEMWLGRTVRVDTWARQSIPEHPSICSSAPQLPCVCVAFLLPPRGIRFSLFYP